VKANGSFDTVIRFPHRRDREKVVDALRNNINVEFKVPETVTELVTHYREHELIREKKAYAAIEANSHYLANHIVPRWGSLYLQGVRTRGRGIVAAFSQVCARDS
jgi:hypothetical protein